MQPRVRTFLLTSAFSWLQDSVKFYISSTGDSLMTQILLTQQYPAYTRDSVIRSVLCTLSLFRLLDIGYACHSGLSSSSLCLSSVACMAWLRHTLYVNCAVWQKWTLDGDFVLLQRSSWTFHQRVMSSSVTAPLESLQLAFGTVCHLTSLCHHSLSIFKQWLKTSIFRNSFNVWLNCVTPSLLIVCY